MTLLPRSHALQQIMLLGIFIAALANYEKHRAASLPAQGIRPLPGPLQPIPDHFRFYDDLAVDSSSVCELHGREMTCIGIAVIGYGYLGKSYVRSPYPHGGQPADSGCADPSNPSYAFDWMCDECHRQWQAAGRPHCYAAMPTRLKSSILW